MRVILLTHGGADLVMKKLAELSDVQVAGVFIETSATPKRGIVEKLKRSIKYDGFFESAKKAFPGRRIETGRGAAGEDCASIARQLGWPVHEVDDFHSAPSLKLLRNAHADLGIIYGTNIIKETVFSIPKLGSINLHQGLAPHYRGGPPVFWELYNGEKEVGITVHFVAAKVDTGDIILQKQIPLRYDPAYGTQFEEFIAAYQNSLREQSADLVCEAVRMIAQGTVERKPQDISVGKRYRLPVKKEKDEMRRRLKQRMTRVENV